jgi:uncharacterized protein YycO
MRKITALYLSFLVIGCTIACQPEDPTKQAPSVPTSQQVVAQRTASPKAPADLYQDGDVIFCTSQSDQSAAIQWVTQSPYSHVGILYRVQGAWYVYEAINTVQRTPLERWIKRGKDKHYVVKRLKNEALLTPAILKKMEAIGAEYQGKRYDYKFEWSDDKLYCSELVWKIYDRALGIELGQLQQLQEFDLSHPVVQQQIKERYGKTLPLEQWVISPARMFESQELETVFASPT